MALLKLFFLGYGVRIKVLKSEKFVENGLLKAVSVMENFQEYVLFRNYLNNIRSLKTILWVFESPQLIKILKKMSNSLVGNTHFKDESLLFYEEFNLIPG